MNDDQTQTVTNVKPAGDVTDQELSQAEMELDTEMAQTQAALGQEKVVDEMLAADAAEDTQATPVASSMPPMETPAPTTPAMPPMETPMAPPVEMPTAPAETPAMPATPPAAAAPVADTSGMPQADVKMGEA